MGKPVRIFFYFAVRQWVFPADKSAIKRTPKGGIVYLPEKTGKPTECSENGKGVGGSGECGMKGAGRDSKREEI